MNTPTPGRDEATAPPVPPVAEPDRPGPVASTAIEPPLFPQDRLDSGPTSLAQAGMAVLLAVGTAALGLPLGLLWSAIAPHTPAVVTSDGAYLADPEAEHRIADEGWYLVLAVAAGIVVTVLAWALLRRYRGVWMLAGLALGGGFGGVLMWWFGRSLGRDQARALSHGPVGTHFGLPVDLRVMRVGLWHHWLPYAAGDVLAISFTVVLLTVLLAGFSPYPSLRPAADPPPVDRKAGDPPADQPPAADPAARPAPPISSGW